MHACADFRSCPEPPRSSSLLLVGNGADALGSVVVAGLTGAALEFVPGMKKCAACRSSCLLRGHYPGFARVAAFRSLTLRTCVVAVAVANLDVLVSFSTMLFLFYFCSFRTHADRTLQFRLTHYTTQRVYVRSRLPSLNSPATHGKPRSYPIRTVIHT